MNSLLGSFRWRQVKQALCRYTKSREGLIESCFLRHSSAQGPQDPLLSDFDAALFVRASSLATLSEARRTIRKELRQGIFGLCPIDPIVLPANTSIINLCRTSYPFRSRYPFETWLPIDAAASPAPPVRDHSLPLDHFPENSLFYYGVDRIEGRRKKHCLERALLNRFIGKDAAWIGSTSPTGKVHGFWDGVMHEVRLWHTFYLAQQAKALPYSQIPCPSDEAPSVPGCYIAAWERPAHDTVREPDGLASVWIYPDLFRNGYSLVVNLNPSASPEECKNALQFVLPRFKGLPFTLQLGTEEACLGRISGLSRLAFFDPWLFQLRGVCLFGDTSLRERMPLPSLEMLQRKFSELALYTIYDCLAAGLYPEGFHHLAILYSRLRETGTISFGSTERAMAAGGGHLHESRKAETLVKQLSQEFDIEVFAGTKHRGHPVEKPVISILLPSFNYDWCIEEAIASVMAQSHQAWELIVVDDGSSDRSLEIISKYQSAYPEKITLVCHSGHRNLGLPKTYEAGLRHCRGEYVAFLEADDLWRADCLEQRLKVFAAYPDVAVVANAVEFFGDEALVEARRKIFLHIFGRNPCQNEPFYAYRVLTGGNPILTFSSFMSRRRLLQEISWNPSSLGTDLWLDWWILAQLSIRGRFYLSSEKLTKWRIHGRSANHFLVEEDGTAGTELRWAAGKAAVVKELRKQLEHVSTSHVPVLVGP